MERTIAILLLVFMVMSYSGCTDDSIKENYTNTNEPDRMLLILAAPSVQDPYYTNDFQQIVDFQIAYANTVIGNDNVILVVDEYSASYYKGKLPDDVIIVEETLVMMIQ